MTNGRWMDAVGSERRVLREVIAQEFMDETGSTWLYDKGEWLVDLLTNPQVFAQIAHAFQEAVRDEPVAHVTQADMAAWRGRPSAGGLDRDA